MTDMIRTPVVQEHEDRIRKLESQVIALELWHKLIRAALDETIEENKKQTERLDQILIKLKKMVELVLQGRHRRGSSDTSQ